MLPESRAFPLPHIRKDMPEKFAFIDTSIFLHYRPFDDVNWLDVLEVKSAALVIALITINELNDKKDGSTPKLRRRAASVLKKLETLWAKGPPVQVRPGVELLLQYVEPSIDYAAHQLDYRSQDDRLLASILEFKATNAGAQIILITADFGQRVKARPRSIETIGLPEELKLPEDADPNEKRIQQLERELLELKRVIPELKLTFSDKSERLEVSFEPSIIMSAEEIEREKIGVRLKHKKLVEESTTGRARSVFPLEKPLDVFARPSKENIERYNTAIESFYGTYDEWLATKATLLNRKRWTICLSFILANSGTAPAENIDVFLHFPDGFELYNEQKLPQVPPEPQPPQKPSGGGVYITGFDVPVNIPSINLVAEGVRPLALGPRNVSVPQIRKTNSYEVKIPVRQLKHNIIEALGPLYVVFNSYEAAGSFGIDYAIVAGNIPKPVLGKLHIIVKKS
jgi:PIN domain-containing protein